MTSWLEEAFGFGVNAEPIAPPPKPRQAPEVKGFVCVVAQPSGAPGDLGKTVDGYYFVESGFVTLCDQHGKPVTKSDGEVDHTAVLAPGDDPRAVAYRMRRRAWLAENEQSAFNGPIYQRVFGVA